MVLNYIAKDDIEKEAIYFIGKSITDKVTIQETEIAAYEWLDYENACQRLTYENLKPILKAANDFIKNNGRNYEKNNTIYKTTN